MIALLRFRLALMTTPVKPMWLLEAENASLRQQLNVLRRKLTSRPRMTNLDRWFLGILYPVPIDPRRHMDHSTGDPCPMASIRFPVLLAVDVAPSRRPSENRRRITRAYHAYD